MVALTGDQVLGIGFLLVYFLVSETLRWYLIGRPLAVRVRERYAEVRAEVERLGVDPTAAPSS